MTTFSKLKKILLPNHLLQGYFLFGFILISTVLEMFSVALVLPVSMLILSPEQIREQEWFIPLFEFLGKPDDINLIKYACLFLIIAYAIKAIFLSVLSFFQYRYVYNVSANVSNRLFSLYLKMPYTFHLDKNSSILLRNITTESALFSNTLDGTITLVIEFTVMLGLLILLFNVDPKGTIIISAICFILLTTIYLFLKKKVLKLGSERLYTEGIRNKIVLQSLQAVKEIKLMKRETGFISQLKKYNNILAKTLYIQHFLASAPRFFVDFIAVLSLMLLLLFKIKQDLQLEEIIVSLSVLGAAFIRIIPSVNRILIAKQRVRAMVPSVDTIYKELFVYNKNEYTYMQQKSFNFNKSINFLSISHTYLNSTKKSLDTINFSIKCGETVGIIGSSGSGKSTIIDILMGLMEPTEGEVRIDDQKLKNIVESWQSLIGYVPQSITLIDDTIRSNVALGVPDNQVDEAAVILALKEADIFNHISNLPNGVNTIVGERGVKLSGGQRQRIGIARALYHKPKVLILDEATSSLDVVTENKVMESIKLMQRAKTIIIVTHRISTVTNCDKILRINDGKFANIISKAELKKLKN